MSTCRMRRSGACTSSSVARGPGSGHAILIRPRRGVGTPRMTRPRPRVRPPVRARNRPAGADAAALHGHRRQRIRPAAARSAAVARCGAASARGRPPSSTACRASSAGSPKGCSILDDLRRRTHELADFVRDAVAHYGSDPARLVAAGYSNGANIAASVLLLQPRHLPASHPVARAGAGRARPAAVARRARRAHHGRAPRPDRPADRDRAVAGAAGVVRRGRAARVVRRRPRAVAGRPRRFPSMVAGQHGTGPPRVTAHHRQAEGTMDVEYLLGSLLRGVLKGRGTRKRAKGAMRLRAGQSARRRRGSRWCSAGLAYQLFESLTKGKVTAASPAPVPAPPGTAASADSRGIGAAVPLVVPPPLPGPGRRGGRRCRRRCPGRVGGPGLPAVRPHRRTARPDAVRRATGHRRRCPLTCCACIRLTSRPPGPTGSSRRPSRSAILEHARRVGAEPSSWTTCSSPRPLTDILGGVQSAVQRQQLYTDGVRDRAGRRRCDDGGAGISPRGRPRCSVSTRRRSARSSATPPRRFTAASREAGERD